MNNSSKFLIFFSFFTAFCMASCEKVELQKNSTSTAGIESRGGCVDECEDCDPVEDCCCSIEILSDPGPGGAILEFCGTSSPCLSTMTCSVEDVGICEDINGFIEDFYLPSQFSRLGFCVPKNEAFGIVSSNGTHTVRITCQVGQTTPQSVTITLNTPPAKPYWETNDNCELGDCF